MGSYLTVTKWLLLGRADIWLRLNGSNIIFMFGTIKTFFRRIYTFLDCMEQGIGCHDWLCERWGQDQGVCSHNLLSIKGGQGGAVGSVFAQ